MDESSKSYDVFVAHSSDAEAFASELAERLRAAGVEVFFDANELKAGEAYDPQLKHAAEHCEIFVFVVSARSCARDAYALTELQWAVGKHRLSLGVQAIGHDDVAPPPAIAARTRVMGQGDRIAVTVGRVRDRLQDVRASRTRARNKLLRVVAAAVLGVGLMAFIVSRFIPSAPDVPNVPSAPTSSPSIAVEGPSAIPSAAVADKELPPKLSPTRAPRRTEPTPSATGPVPTPMSPPPGRPTPPAPRGQNDCSLATSGTERHLEAPGAVQLKAKDGSLSRGMVTPKGYVLTVSYVRAQTDLSLYLPAKKAQPELTLPLQGGPARGLFGILCPAGGRIYVDGSTYLTDDSLEPGAALILEGHQATPGKLLGSMRQAGLFNEGTFSFFTTTTMARSGDAGAPVTAGGRIVGLLYSSSSQQDANLVAPIRGALHEFPYAF